MIVISSVVHSINVYKVPTIREVLDTKDTTEYNKVPALLELTVVCENMTIKIFPVLERKFLHFYYNSRLYYKSASIWVLAQRIGHNRLKDMVGVYFKTSALLLPSNPLPHRPCIWAVGKTLGPCDWMANLANREGQGN